MQFLDRARIFVKAGDGGNGVTAFRREKFVPRGGPSGGNGGRGGDIFMVSTDQLNTLLHFRFNPRYVAERGGHGEGSNRTGHEGEDVTILVPVGTVVTDRDTGEIIHDFVRSDDKVLIAAGGRGGRGNASFASSTNRAPRRHDDGKPGEERTLQLELKLIADVGLVGLPNAGKSSLLGRITRAAPKVAAYPFTTLAPVLGTLQLDDRQLVIADIPGLIEGASQGAGLGHEFLAHVERTRLLVHVLDLAPADGSDPVANHATIEAELAAHDPRLAALPADRHGIRQARER